MRVVTAPAGSGRTQFVMEAARAALRAGDTSLRVLAPTATLAQHLRNELAREGFVFRASMVQTLHQFVEPWCGDKPEVARATLHLIAEEAVRRAKRPEFARVAGLAGFCASTARVIAEFSAAGCASERLAQNLPDAPLAQAFLAVYREVERGLEARGLAMRAERLARAAKRIESEGTGEIRTILIEGFHALPEPELRVISALDSRAAVTMVLTDEVLAQKVCAAVGPVERKTLPPSRPRAAERFFRAQTVERESEEIARRIVEQVSGGRLFREIGIIVRAADAYEPVLRSTLARFGIPARFYFDAPLDRQPAIRMIAGAMDAMLEGWDHERMLAALRLAPRFANSIAMDRFDFAVREQMPGAGLGGLKALLVDDEGKPITTDAGRLLRKIDRIGAIEEWRGFEMAPKDWAAQSSALTALYRPARPVEGVSHARAIEWRSQSAALEEFEKALQSTAAALDANRRMSLAEFWGAMKQALRLTPLRAPDGRRNVVHVLSADEARQWELPVVFVCGMAEKQFPDVHRQDGFFPDWARRRLQQNGIGVRTTEDFEREERALFDAAAGTAASLLTFSYAEFDEGGNPNLQSIYLEGRSLVAEPVSGASPRPAAEAETALQAPALEISALDLLASLKERTAHFSPSSLETYLTCPFKYFAGRTLKLQPPPVRPEERLDPSLQGDIVHETLAEWYRQPRDVGGLFDEVFARVAEENRIPLTLKTERLRDAMREDVKAFAADAQWPRAAFQSEAERDFDFPLEGLLIIGKIDRLDTGAEDRAFVIDYKYSSAQNVRKRLEDPARLQAELYLMAAERAFGKKPAGMFYVSLRGEVKYFGWRYGGSPEALGKEPPAEWLETAARRALGAAAGIRAGRVEAKPIQPEVCDHCEFCDVCRYAAPLGAELAEEAGE